MTRSSLIETVRDELNGTTYEFHATFKFIENLHSLGMDVNDAYTTFTQGLHDPTVIKACLVSSLFKKGDKEVPLGEREKIVIEIIEQYGLMEASALAFNMLSRAIIGDLKKSQADTHEKIQGVLEQIYPSSHWKSFLKAGLFVAAISMISGPAGWMILEFLKTLF